MTSVGKLGTGRRLALLLASIVGVLALSGGMALAATVTCQVGVYCLGTKDADTIGGTANKDAIYAAAATPSRPWARATTSTVRAGRTGSSAARATTIS
jgi:hypothetical protein